MASQRLPRANASEAIRSGSATPSRSKFTSESESFVKRTDQSAQNPAGFQTP